MSATLLDRVVEYVSPVRGAKRAIARASLSDVRKYGQSRRGAIPGRTGTGWTDERTVNGAGARTRRDLREMTGRARQTFNESAVGRSLLLTETDNVVGRRFSLQMKTTSPEFNKEAAKRFEDWLEVADITGRLTGAGLMRTSWLNPRRDGDGGFILLKVKGYARLQYIASDQITMPTGGGKYDVLNTFDGVECNAAGAAKWFHIRDADEFGGLRTTRVSADDFVYIPFIDGPESVRGTTVYSPIFDKIDQLDSYTESVVLAARLACIFGLIHKVRSPGAATGPLGDLLNAQGQPQKAISLENGMLRVEGTDEDTYQVQASQPMSQTPEFIRAQMRLIALPFDMPIEIAMKDLSQVNFAGGRIGLLSFYRSCRIKQDWLIARWNRIVFWWLSIEAERQRLGFDDAFTVPFPEKYGEFELHGQEWESNSPIEEAQADLLEWSMGIRSPQQLCERRNRNFLDIQSQIKAARDEANRLGNPTVVSSLTRDPGVTAFAPPNPPDTGVARPPPPVTVIQPA